MGMQSNRAAPAVLLGVLVIASATVLGFAPPGSPSVSAVAGLWFVALLAAALGFFGFRAMGLDPARARWSAVIVAALLSVGLTVRAGLDLQTGAQLSQSLIRPAPELGPGGKALLPNLVNAVSVVPDRPHHPDDVNAPDRLERFTRMRTFAASTNAQGLRGPAILNPARGFRVLCIGDSVTFGWGVSDDQSYPAHLGRLLQTEVLNAGMPAAKPAHMAKWLQLNARTIQPDLVVFAARPHWAMPQPFEDYRNAIMAAEAAIAPARLAVVLPPVSTFDTMGVRDRLKEVSGLQRVLQGRPFLELTEAFWAAQAAPGVVMETKGDTQRMVRLPHREPVAEGTAKANRLAPELIKAFEADHSLIEPLFFDGGHPDEAGNALFATEVAAFLNRNRLLPQ